MAVPVRRKESHPTVRAGTTGRTSRTHRLELDLVRLVARGRTNAEIAAQLSITVGTVKTHLGNVQAKLDARNRVEIAAWAWESGFVGQERAPGGCLTP
ncbi:response regulator transcription factor [Streptomyces sp. NPDC059443]|uniref:response regulator transcription factor n=1 Tax=unclassified Streptomyces TaxID=2593676 RepID=UPI0036CC73FE